MMKSSKSLKSVDQQGRLNKHRPMIVFGEDWGGHPSSTQHLIKVLRESRDVIWINSIGLRAPSVSVRDIGRIFNKVFAFASSYLTKLKRPQQKSQQEEGKNATSDTGDKHHSTNSRFKFKVISPLIFPCPNSSLMVKINRFLLKLQVKRNMESIEQRAPIVWTSLPTAVDYLSLFKGHADEIGRASCRERVYAPV